MKKKLILIILFFALVGTGCSDISASLELPACRVVTGITIREDSADGSVQQRYTNQKKMIKVLMCLRQLNAWENADIDPATLPGASYTITLDLSDGSRKQYLQKDIRYLSLDRGPWKVIDPERGIRIPLLLAAIPGDEPEGTPDQ